jgi:PucR family transcriptional regulator, purine catabolism regulatory protein
MATIETVRAAVVPEARWVVPPRGDAGESGDVAWVRLMRARVPAFDALEAGDLAIVPLAALAVVAPDEDAVAALVRSAAETALAGVVLVGDASEGRPSTVERFVDAARGVGVPVLDAGAGDAFAIERATVDFLVRHRGELDREATALETRLAQVALADGGPAEFAAAIAGFLKRAIAIEGPDGAPLAVHAPPDAPGAPAAAAAYARRNRPARVRIPLGFEGGPPAVGSLALLGDAPATELERATLGRIVRFLALELARQTRAVGAGRPEPLPADGPPWVVIVARQVAPGRGADSRTEARVPPDQRAQLTAETAGRESVRRAIRAIAPARRMALRGDALSVELRVVAAAPEKDDPGGLVLAERIARFLGRSVAVSRPFTDAAGRSTAEADARLTLEAIEALPEPLRVARADRLPAYRLLGSLRHLPDGERQARLLLAPLLVGRPDVRRERLETLRAVLDHPDAAEAAAALGVHRNTIAYRVRRIEEATGWRLTDPDLRLPLALAVRLVREEQVL